MTSNTETLQEKLSGIQRELKAPKDKFNAFGKYAYRSCEGILDALKPYLEGLVLTIYDDIVMLGDRFYVKATVTLTDGKDFVHATAFAREPKERKGMDESQITGAASSYARKYALNGMFCIDDNKDADHGSEEATVSKKEKKDIEQKIAGFTEDQILAFRCPASGGKYAGMKITDIANDITEAGTNNGLGYIEKVIDYTVTTAEGYEFQQACKRFYEEIVGGKDD